MREFFAVLMVVLMVGCAGSNGGGSAGEAESRAELAATLDVQVGGEEVRLGLHITNTTSRPLELTFPTSQRYDFAVARGSGEEVWRWSDGMAFLQAISTATLEPGESWDMEALWEPGPVEGELVATGWLTARDRSVRQSATFELP